MAVQHYRSDPRSEVDRRADEEVLRRFESGEILQVDGALEQQAMAYVQRRREDRRHLVATLGRELGVLRKAHGLTQETVARAVGTNKSNISRLESGRYGGLTVERFIAVLDAFDALARTAREPANQNHRAPTDDVSHKPRRGRRAAGDRR
jgi:DNA-binding XRE family transcriptional regulator